MYVCMYVCVCRYLFIYLFICGLCNHAVSKLDCGAVG